MNRAPNSVRWVRAVGRLAVVGLGALHAWAGAARHSMNPDGVAYLDIGDAYARQDWSSAINTYWSPLYSWVLGAAMELLRPSVRWEFPTVHAVNFLILVLALVCFEFFWHRLGRECQDRAGRGDGATFPEWLWLALGYALFAYTGLTLTKVWSVTPDMLVAAVVFLAAGLIVRFRAGLANWWRFALFGTVLGVGYLAKTAMFPLAFVFLGVGAVAVGDRRRTVRLLPVAALCFLAVSAPYIAVLSSTKGSLTYGETGRLMYAWHINGVPHPHWEGETPGAGTPEHGSRRIFDLPRIYEIGRPGGGTYPVAYDPAYWYAGVRPSFEWRGQVRVLQLSLQSYFDLAFRQQAGLFVGLLVLLYLMRKHGVPLRHGLPREYALTIAATLALGMYAIVHVQPRYVGAFVVLFWADLLAGVRLPSSTSRSWLSFVGGIMLAVLLINLAAFNLQGFARLTAAGGPNRATLAAGPPTWPGAVAEELHRHGVRPGDKVAVIGYGFDSYWARLARVQIAAEMFGWEADPFWLGESSIRDGALRAFASTGARAIVAERVPPYARLEGWHRVEQSNYYVLVLE